MLGSRDAIRGRFRGDRSHADVAQANASAALEDAEVKAGRAGIHGSAMTCPFGNLTCV